MLQLTYTGPDALEWREAPEPSLSSDAAALVRPRAVATCDLDALIIEGGSPFPPPFALGHECVAEVLDLGDAVSSLEVGQLVSVPFQISCGECAACRQGRTSNCENVAFMSSYGFGPAVERWGGFLSDVGVRALRRAHARADPRGPGAGCGGERIGQHQRRLADGRAGARGAARRRRARGRRRRPRLDRAVRGRPGGGAGLAVGAVCRR